MKDPKADLRRAILDYKAALEDMVRVEDDMASCLVMLADELDRQGQHRTADAVQRASHYHRAVSIKSRAIAASLSLAD